MLIRKMVGALRVLGLSISLAAPLAAQSTEERVAVHLQLDQARQVALNALRTGQPRLAFALSDGLLEADPKDGQALYIQAKALGQMRDFDGGRKRAAEAYRTSSTDLQHFETATLAAQLSIAGQRMTHSQIWLRRAVHYAPNETARDIAVAAFQQARHRNPLNLLLSFSISPSDNVNNGANSPRNIIDGVPVQGVLSPSAQAISGWTATLNVQASYRISESQTSETRLVARALAYHVEFNETVDDLSASELASHRLGFGVAQIWRPNEHGFWRLNAEAGRTWSGGDLSYDYLSASTQRVRNISADWRMSFGGAVEQQFNQNSSLMDATVWSGTVGVTHIFDGGSALRVSALYRETVSDSSTRASTQWTGIVRYTHGRSIGPATIGASLGRSTVDYYGYTFPSFGFRGRTDESWFGEVTATINSASYMGFVPVVSLRSERSRSNISRFDVDQTGISIGVRSEF